MTFWRNLIRDGWGTDRGWIQCKRHQQLFEGPKQLNSSAGLDEGAIHQITRNSYRHGGGNLRTDCIDRPADTNPTLGMRIGLSPMAFLWRSVLQRRSPFKLRRCQELGKAAGAAARGACRRPQRMLRELAAPLQHRSRESRGRRPGSWRSPSGWGCSAGR